MTIENAINLLKDFNAKELVKTFYSVEFSTNEFAARGKYQKELVDEILTMPHEINRADYDSSKGIIIYKKKVGDNNFRIVISVKLKNPEIPEIIEG